jgi:hypothetical protein
MGEYESSKWDPRVQFAGALLFNLLSVYIMVHALVSWDGFHSTWDGRRAGTPWVMLAAAPGAFMASLRVCLIARRRGKSARQSRGLARGRRSDHTPSQEG